MAAKNFIVAIELGSSKVTGIVGEKKPDGSISVLAAVKEPSSTFIHKGVVYNIDKTAQCLKNIVKKLEAQLKTQITQVFVGIGGQSIRGVRNVVVQDFASDTKVTQEMVGKLIDANNAQEYPDQERIDVADLEYKVNSQLQSEPIGIQATRLEGNYLNILQRKAFYHNINECFETADISLADLYLSPLALADSVLTEAERRSGCALVDLGADTTTVSVYHKNMLRHLVVIPLGANNITKDIATLQMEEADAERMKLKYGSAYTESSELDSDLTYPIDQERTVEASRFNTIVEARVQEIIENVSAQIPNEYLDHLLGGIILTGGGANLKNIEKAFQVYTRVDKIRTAKFVTMTVNSSNELVKNHNGMMNTVIGLLSKGSLNCAGDELSAEGDIFNTQHRTQQTPTRKPRQADETEAGVIRTQREKEEAENLARLKREEEERQEREAEEARLAEEARMAKEEEEARRRNNIWNRLKRKIRDFGEDLVKPEE